MLRISAFAAALVMGIYVGIAAEDTVMESWEQKGTYRNGYILNFVLSIRDSFVAEPDGYSKDVVEEISKEYPALENKGSEDDPTIIVIMNESFADLSVISHYGFETTEEVTPFSIPWTPMSLRDMHCLLSLVQRHRIPSGNF